MGPGTLSAVYKQRLHISAVSLLNAMWLHKTAQHASGICRTHPPLCCMYYTRCMQVYSAGADLSLTSYHWGRHWGRHWDGGWHGGWHGVLQAGDIKAAAEDSSTHKQHDSDTSRGESVALKDFRNGPTSHPACYLGQQQQCSTAATPRPAATSIRCYIPG